MRITKLASRLGAGLALAGASTAIASFLLVTAFVAQSPVVRGQDTEDGLEAEENVRVSSVAEAEALVGYKVATPAFLPNGSQRGIILIDTPLFGLPKRVTQHHSKERGAVWILVIALLILHQDFWYWDDTTLVFDFMPIGLFYHAVFSIVAAGVWAMAVKFAWPTHLEKWADEFEDAADAEGSGRP